MTSTLSIRDTYRSFTGRLEPAVGLLNAYVVVGIVQSALVNGASVRALSHVLTTPLYTLLWPIGLFDPVYWTFIAVGLLVGLGVLSLLEHSRLPVTAPERLPTLRPRHSAEVVGTLLVAELVARFTTAAAFVTHLHIWPPHNGDPGQSIGATVALYQDVLAFFGGYVEMPYLVWAGHLLPESRSLPFGGPNQNHVLRQVGEIQFFDGIGFALVVGYLVALGLSYFLVRKASSWLLSRSEVSLSKGT